MTTARLAAARALVAVEGSRITLPAAIDRARADVRDERDRALLLELATGAVRWQGQLDAVIAAESHRQVEALDPAVRATLRLGAYQILHLDRVPARAVVFEAVEMVRALGQSRAAGFVNAILRAIDRKGSPAVLPPPPIAGASLDDQATRAAAAWSHPAWLVRRWIARLGLEGAASWCAFNNTAPEVTVRAAGSHDAVELLAALRDAGLEARPSPFVGTAIRLGPGALGRVPASLRSWFVIQDEGAQIVAQACGASSGMRCLDVCAAPGGKTIALWADVHEAGRVVASDYRPARVRLLARTLRAHDLPPLVVTLDATAPLPFLPVFARVLLDAPCSGLGTLRRDPDVKWRRQPSDLEGFAATQRLMAHQASFVVKPGGALIYATCSSEPEENDEVVVAFLAEHPLFQLAPIPVAGTAGSPESLVDASGVLRTNPARHGLDAYFAAVLVRSEPA